MKEELYYKYYLSKMNEYVNDINDIISRYDNDLDAIFCDKLSKHAINMCIVQIGEYAKEIRNHCPHYDNLAINIDDMYAMRCRIVHGYGQVDYTVVKETINHSIPELKSVIEKTVDERYLKNPYLLLEEIDYINSRTYNEDIEI